MTEARRAAVPGYTAVRGLSADRAGALIEARDDATGRRVVLRVLSPALLADARLMRHLRSSAQLRESLRHTNLVSVVAVADSGRALVYQWIDGVTLDRLVMAGPLRDVAAAVLFDDCLRGLEALHQRGMPHRDLRPESVVVDQSGRAMLRDADIPSPPLHAGWRSGTPQYMAPELWHGEPHSVASDLYAVTCLFALCLEGTPPFAASDLAVLRRLHERGDLPGGTLPAPLRGLVAEGMAKDPRQRPASASRLRADCEVAAAAYFGETWRAQGRRALVDAVAAAASAPAGASEDAAVGDVLLAAAPAAWWRRSRIAAAAILAVLAALIVVVVVGATALTTPAPQNPTPAPVPLATPTGRQAVPAGGGPFTPPASASLPLAGTPVPSAPAPVTPGPSATTSISPVTPSASGSPSPSATPRPTPTPTSRGCPILPCA